MLASPVVLNNINNILREHKAILSAKENNKKIILIDKLNFKSYLILCENEKFKILRKSKKYKKTINQLKNLFPEHNLNISSNNFTFIRLLNEPLNEIVVGIKNNQVIGGGSGIYEI